MEGQKLYGFAPVWDKEIRILVVGSMPSVCSLQRQQYFANPRNAFWKIVYHSFDEPVQNDYEERLRFLLGHGIGLWDAAAGCERRGSLDSAMRKIELNDFSALFLSCASLRTVLCNGAQAHGLFLRTMERTDGHVRAVKLPSTSPALAALSYEEKLAAWKPYLRGEK